jgi:hypothetical protein
MIGTQMVCLFISAAQHHHIFSRDNAAAQKTLRIGQAQITSAENEYFHIASHGAFAHPPLLLRKNHGQNSLFRTNHPIYTNKYPFLYLTGLSDAHFRTAHFDDITPIFQCSLFG